MGYTTDFDGFITIEPPLNAKEIAFLQKFSETRRMDREKGPYFVDGTGDSGQGHDPDIRNFNEPPMGQPGLWCQWVPSEDGTTIGWDGAEKFYHASDWMVYLIDHFLRPNCKAKGKLPFLQANHICNGTIKAQGENRNDRWKLIVKANRVWTEYLE